MTDNTKIWDKLGKTDPEHTKEFTRGGGFKGTAIKPMFTYKSLTDYFGPCGKGWGIEKPEFQVVPGANDETLVFCTVTGWWSNGGDNKNSVFGVGGDKVVAKNKYGLASDDEAFKKSFTDAITNAFKFIGAGADVHMGMYDDSKYVNSVRDEFAASKPKPVDYTVHADNEDQFYEGFELRLSQMPTVSDVNELCKVHGQSINRMKKENPDRAAALKGLVDKRRNELAQKP